ncbi:MAG TPA: hypothetical protein PKE55_10575 [Kiritimatiellia bacterium]|nr:hypothetical protein [Kiritimatiellia bacterium]
MRPFADPLRTIPRRWLSHAALVLLGILTGCVTQTLNAPGDEWAETRLVVTRVADEVNLSWSSKPGLNYTLVYATSRAPGAPWLPLPGGESVRGTGQTITFTDRVPEGQNRYYRLQVQQFAIR